jgi:hypothetical protein
VSPSVVVVGVSVVVVPPPHGVGQASVTLCPTAFLRQTNASLALTPPAPFVSQTQLGSHVCDPTAVFKMNRQSEAVGFVPFVTG